MEDVENMDGNQKGRLKPLSNSTDTITWTKNTYSLWSEGFREAVGGCTVMAEDPSKNRHHTLKLHETLGIAKTC